MTGRVGLVVPDAGPLISLARGDCLHLLLALDLPIWIVDEVRHEVTADAATRPDAARIAAFIADHADQVHVFTTHTGAAAAQYRASGNTHRRRGIGEAAIVEFLMRLGEVTNAPDDPILLIYEDYDVIKKRSFMSKNVHLLSTRGLLLGMQKRGMIASAEIVWRAILATGRTPSHHETDLPAGSGGSSW